MQIEFVGCGDGGRFEDGAFVRVPEFDLIVARGDNDCRVGVLDEGGVFWFRHYFHGEFVVDPGESGRGAAGLPR